ncbi:MAG TPA: NAD(P)-binding protein [Candidatus Acidoferrales bacterium]|jgi:spermidine dehydrogenase|nr:NAD(P)-binding protein [Candidatus Acidoferrales bacterium]
MADGFDRELGMGRNITRRDFLNGMGVALTSSMLPTSQVSAFAKMMRQSAQEGQSGEYYPPTRTGMRGSHPGSFEVAHELAMGQHWDNAPDTGERYDMVIVGAGISGLSSAYFFTNSAGPNAKVLLLDNHDDFGGHAKRNEFHYNGRMLLLNGGTSNLEVVDQYSTVSRTLLKAIGIDLQRLQKASDTTGEFYNSMNLGTATFFAKEVFGSDKRVMGAPKGGQMGFRGRGIGADWATWLKDTPFSDTARKDLIRLYDPTLPDFYTGLTDEEKKYKLSRITYQDYLLNVVKVTPEVIPFLNRARNEIDVFAAYAAFLEGHPGFQGLKLAPYPKVGPLTHIGGTQHGNEVVSYGGPTIEFPDGNASITRLLVRSMIPDALPGNTMEDAITSHLNYSYLDRDNQHVRVRLNSTAVHVKHLGDPETAKEVEITYVRGGKAEKVRAQNVILACYNMIIPYLCPEMSTTQKDALAYCVKKPLVYTSVCIKDWTPFADAKLRSVTCPQMFHQGFSLGRAPVFGDYKGPRSPQDPMVLSLTAEPVGEGKTERDQYRTGRMKMLGWDFEYFEKKIRDQLARGMEGTGFDPARDIVAITVNRWPHGYAYMYNMLYDKPEWALLDADDKPCYVGRKRFGRVSIGNSDAAGSSHTDAAIDEGFRAAGEQLVIRSRSTETPELPTAAS